MPTRQCICKLGNDWVKMLAPGIFRCTSARVTRVTKNDRRIPGRKSSRIDLHERNPRAVSTVLVELIFSEAQDLPSDSGGLLIFFDRVGNVGDILPRHA